MYKELRFRVQGTTPTILHNGQLANPLNRYSKALKEISGKRKKTDEDYEKMARIEWEASLYLDAKERVCWPGENIERMICAAARKTKAGKEALSGIIVEGLCPIEYDGPKGVEALWADERFRRTDGVRVQQARVMRTRPVFNDWKLSFTVSYLPDVCKPDDIRSWVETAGVVIGLSDWRPKFGKFIVLK